MLKYLSFERRLLLLIVISIILCSIIFGSAEVVIQSSVNSCNINRVDVTTIVNGEGLSPQDIREHILEEVIWSDPKNTTWSCVDGRSISPLFGTPAGDSGEFLLGLTTLEHFLSLSLTEDEVEQYFKRFIEDLSVDRPFYMHTDEHAIEQIKEELGWHDFDPRIYSPDNEKDQELVLSIFTNPLFIGCGHLKFMALHPDEYKTRTELVQMMIRVYYRTLWNKTHQGKISHETDVVFVELEGVHTERAVVIVNANYSLLPENHSCRKLAPQIPSSGKVNSFFLDHGAFVEMSIRNQMALFFYETVAERSSEITFAMFSKYMNDLAVTQLNLSLGFLASGEPVYSVTIHASDALEPKPTHDIKWNYLIYLFIISIVAGVLVFIAHRYFHIFRYNL